MSIFTSNGTSFLWQFVKDPEVRAGMYMWLLIAGFCVLMANAMAAGGV